MAMDIFVSSVIWLRFNEMTIVLISAGVPTVFVTNGGNMLRHDKALQLSNWLGIDVSYLQ